MIACGLLGEKLGHSYSPAIHALLGDYEYKLYEHSPDQVEDFVRNGTLRGFNVTIPYKKTVAALCDQLSPMAQSLGSVNTVVRRADGTLFGDNTDAYGFYAMVKKSGVALEGKKCLVLGSGGASVTVQAVLQHAGAAVTVISRSGENNYENLYLHTDAAVIVNTTPLGMHPKTAECPPLDYTQIGDKHLLYDVIYNPEKTLFLERGEERGATTSNGMEMLIGQAKAAWRIWTEE